MLRGKKGALAASENAANRARAKGSESTYVAIVAAVSFGAGPDRRAPEVDRADDFAFHEHGPGLNACTTVWKRGGRRDAPLGACRASTRQACRPREAIAGTRRGLVARPSCRTPCRCRCAVRRRRRLGARLARRTFRKPRRRPRRRRLVAAAVCAEQVIDLVDRSVTRLHFYTMNTMNRADLVFAICHLIGLRTRDEIARPAAASSLLIAR